MPVPMTQEEFAQDSKVGASATEHQLVEQEVQLPVPIQLARIKQLLEGHREQKEHGPVPMTIEEQVSAFLLLSKEELHELTSLPLFCKQFKGCVAGARRLGASTALEVLDSSA